MATYIGKRDGDRKDGQMSLWAREREGALHRMLLALLILYAVAIPFDDYHFMSSIGLAAGVCALFLLRGSLCRTSSSRACYVMLTALIVLLVGTTVSFLVNAADEMSHILHVNINRNSIFGVTVVFAFGFGLREERWVRRLLWLMLSAYGVFFLFDAMGVLFAVDSWDPDGRFIGSRNLPTVYAMESLQLISLYLGAAVVVHDRRASLVLGFGALLSGILLLMTGTRSALLVFALVCVPAVLLVRARSYPFQKKALLVCVWTFVMVPLLAFGWYGLNPKRRSPITVQSRLGYWRAALALASDSSSHTLLVGHGPFPAVFRNATKQNETAKQHILEFNQTGHLEPWHAHNDLIQTFLETGLIGAIALATIWLVAFGCLLSSERKGRSSPTRPELSGLFFVALVTVAAMSQLDCVLRHQARSHIAWFIVGLAFAHFRLSHPREHSEDADVQGIAQPLRLNDRSPRNDTGRASRPRFDPN